MHTINKYFFFWPGGKTHPDNLLNNTGDIIAGCMGWIFAKLLDDIGHFDIIK